MKKEPTKFMRFGGLSPVKQTQYTAKEDKSFHNPPRRKGIYAFPWPYVSRFLLGATDDVGHVSNKTSWLLDEAGNRMKEEDYFVNFDSNWNYVWKPGVSKALKRSGMKYSHIITMMDGDVSYIVVMKKPKVFTYDGEIWHHLRDHMNPGDVLSVSGSWIKTTFSDYQDAFSRMKHSYANDSYSQNAKWGGSFTVGNTNPFKRSFGSIPYSKDPLEVFIEKL